MQSKTVTIDSASGTEENEPARQAVEAIRLRIEQRLAARKVTPPAYPTSPETFLSPAAAQRTADDLKKRLEEDFESPLGRHQYDSTHHDDGYLKNWDEFSVIGLARESEELRAEAFALQGTAEIGERLKALSMSGWDVAISFVAPARAWRRFGQQVEAVLQDWHTTDSVREIDDLRPPGWRTLWNTTHHYGKEAASEHEITALTALAANPNESLEKGLARANPLIEGAKADLRQFLEQPPEGVTANDYGRALQNHIARSGRFTDASVSRLSAVEKRADRLSLINLILDRRPVQRNHDYYQALAEESRAAWSEYFASTEGQAVAARFEQPNPELAFNLRVAGIVSAAREAGPSGAER